MKSFKCVYFKVVYMKEIDCYEDLQEMDKDGEYKLVSDIDASASSCLFERFVPLYEFRGVFDGNGYTIRNLSVIVDDRFCGFIYNNGGVVKDVVFDSCEFVQDTDDSSEILNNFAVGSVVGYNSGLVSNVTVRECNVSGSDFVGGLVGTNRGDIKGCVVVDCSVSGSDHVGGFVGTNLSGSVKSCGVSGVSIDSSGNSAGFVHTNKSVHGGSEAVVGFCVVESVISTGCGNFVGFTELNAGSINHCYSGFEFDEDEDGAGFVYMDQGTIVGCSCKESLFSEKPEQYLDVGKVCVQERLLKEFKKEFEFDFD